VHSVTGYIEYVKTNLQDWKVSWFSVLRVYKDLLMLCATKEPHLSMEPSSSK